MNKTVQVTVTMPILHLDAFKARAAILGRSFSGHVVQSLEDELPEKARKKLPEKGKVGIRW